MLYYNLANHVLLYASSKTLKYFINILIKLKIKQLGDVVCFMIHENTETHLQIPVIVKSIVCVS